MKLIRIVLFLAALIVGVSIGLSNRQAVELRLEPIPYAVDLPLFVIIFASIFVGLLIGAAAMWLRDGQVRRRAREAERRSRDLEREAASHDQGEKRPALPDSRAA